MKRTELRSSATTRFSLATMIKIANNCSKTIRHFVFKMRENQIQIHYFFLLKFYVSSCPTTVFLFPIESYQAYFQVKKTLVRFQTKYGCSDHSVSADSLNRRFYRWEQCTLLSLIAALVPVLKHYGSKVVKLFLILQLGFSYHSLLPESKFDANFS